jgi:hypothetical protein
MLPPKMEKNENGALFEGGWTIQTPTNKVPSGLGVTMSGTFYKFQFSIYSLSPIFVMD